MTVTVELIPLAEGNRITVNENEKVTIGRGSSLGVSVPFSAGCVARGGGDIQGSIDFSLVVQ